MTIKGKLEGTGKFGTKIYTLIYIKFIMKKDLLNITGDSTEQTNNLYEEKTEKEQVRTHPCVTESSSADSLFQVFQYTSNKQNIGNQVYPQYKITINYKLHEFSPEETRQQRPYELDI